MFHIAEYYAYVILLRHNALQRARSRDIRLFGRIWISCSDLLV